MPRGGSQLVLYLKSRKAKRDRAAEEAQHHAHKEAAGHGVENSENGNHKGRCEL